MSRKRRTVVLGFYERRNFGDDVFRTVLANVLPDLIPCTRPLFLAPDRRIGELGKGLLPGWLSDEQFTNVGRIPTLLRAAAQVYAAATSDHVVLGGGSVLEDLSPGLQLQQRIGRDKRWYALGVSIGPFADDTARERVATALSRFDVVAVRDKVSLRAADILDLPGRVTYTGDLAGAMSASALAPAGGPEHIGFAPCNTPRISLQDQLAILRQVVRQRAAPVRVFALNNHPQLGDDELARYSVSHLRSQGHEASLFRYVDHGVTGTSRAIAGTTVMVSTRLHGGIVAYLAGRPVILLEYHPKCTAFLDDIGQPADLRVGRSDASRHVLPDLTEVPDPVVSPQVYRGCTTQALGSLSTP